MAKELTRADFAAWGRQGGLKADGAGLKTKGKRQRRALARRAALARWAKRAPAHAEGTE